jgi:hypothetical protein
MPIVLTHLIRGRLARFRSWGFALLCLLPSLALAEDRRGRLGDVLLDGVPHVQQEPDFCGEACAEMWLRKLGHPISQRAVFDLTGIDPGLGRGAWTAELARALTRLGFSVGDVWFRVAVNHANAGLEAQFAALHADLVRGVPTIVCMHYDGSPDSSEHFRLIVGYRAATDSVVYQEPAESSGGYRTMSRARFLKLWPLKYGTKEWTVVRLVLDGTRVVDPPKPPEHDDAAFAQHVLALREKLPAGFSLVIEKPFVVIGDESAATVQRRAETTIRWTTEQLRGNYFEKEPRRIIDVWLFKNAKSYVSQVKRLTGVEPYTPYGFYSDSHGLLMNISTGAGTLVHEMVHPFVDANVAHPPPWFNEGLASLYEQSAEREGRIVGLTNWRLAGLRNVIEKHSLPSFRQLTAMGNDKFYKDDQGDNYAQARYLFYYLQEKGLIRPFVAAFKARGTDDPSGYATLQKILAETDMQDFQERWVRWVLTLRFDG